MSVEGVDGRSDEWQGRNDEEQGRNDEEQGWNEEQQGWSVGRSTAVGSMFGFAPTDTNGVETAT